MRIKITRSFSGPWGTYGSGTELDVGPDMSKERAMSLLNSGLAVPVKDAGAENARYPLHTGGGWYQLSDGSKVQGKGAAETAQKKLGA